MEWRGREGERELEGCGAGWVVFLDPRGLGGEGEDGCGFARARGWGSGGAVV